MDITLLGVKNYKSWCILTAFYALVIYFAIYQAAWGLDFASYYASSHEVGLGINPYHNYISDTRLWFNTYLPGNPNPPITLLLFSIFSYFNYPLAFFLWVFFSLALGLYAVYLSLSFLFPDGELKPYLPLFFLIYLISFPVVMNTGMGQLGNLLFFLSVIGYDAYLKHKDRQAAFWWGLLIAIKLFPGLLFLYVLFNRRLQLFAWMLVCFIFLSAAPLLILGSQAYVDYFLRILNGVCWYGINWNASLFGFLYRNLVEVQHVTFNNGAHSGSLNYIAVTGTQSAKMLYYVITLIILALWTIFFKRIATQSRHGSFAFTLILMLILSPMGWVYYFPLLFIPLACTFYANLQDNKRMLGWFLTLSLLYFPLPITHVMQMDNGMQKLTIYSIHFYGLLALAYLTLTLQYSPKNYKQLIVPEYVPSVFKLITYFSMSIILLRIVFLSVVGLT